MTTENNKIIAEFMGAKETKDTKIMYPIYEGDSSYIKNLEYHKNWNWLMEVVEKIESLNVIVEIRENVCYIETSPNNYTSELESTKIQAVYNACVEFIKWYNE